MIRFGRFAWVVVLVLGIVGSAPFYRSPEQKQIATPVATVVTPQTPLPIPVIPEPKIVAVKTSAPEPSVILLAEQKLPPPPVIQLPEWTKQKPTDVPWNVSQPPPPPDNPYSHAAATQPSPRLQIIEPPRVVLKPLVPKPSIKKHRVVDGDSWRLLSLRYFGDELHTETIIQANRSLITHPDLMPVGKELVIPLP
jgi:nucleoid-associated protein YgaU